MGYREYPQMKRDYDKTLEVGESLLNYKLNENKKMNSHSFKMYFGFAIIFLVGAGSAWQGGFTPANIITMIVAGLLALQHNLNGNTATAQ